MAAANVRGGTGHKKVEETKADWVGVQKVCSAHARHCTRKILCMQERTQF